MQGTASGRPAKQRHRFTCAVKVRRTFNIMSSFPGEGGKGDGRYKAPKFPRIRRKAKPEWRKRENAKTKSVLQRMG